MGDVPELIWSQISCMFFRISGWILIAKVYRRNTLKVDIPSIENFIIKIVHLLSRINDSPLFFIFPIFTLYQEQRKNVIQRLIARILVVIVNICIKNRKTLSQKI